MPTFEIIETRRLTLNRPNRLANMYMLSPFAWTSGETTSLFLRAVPRRNDDPRMKVSEVWYGSSEDGFNFAMEPYPTIFPGPELYDVDGVRGSDGAGHRRTVQRLV